MPAYNSGFASVFAFKHCAKFEHLDKAKNRTQSRKTLAVSSSEMTAEKNNVKQLNIQKL